MPHQPQLQQASNFLVKAARQEQRERRDQTTDVVELFLSCGLRDRAIKSGLRVTPPHESLLLEDGWDPAKKEHRQRLRALLRDRRPGFLTIRCPRPRGSATSSFFFN